jgi:hypothetical protein
LAKEEMEELTVDLKEMEELRLELAKFFCEDDTTFKLDECIKIFNAFCEKFKKAIQVWKKKVLCIFGFTLCLFYRRTKKGKNRKRKRNRGRNRGRSSWRRRDTHLVRSRKFFALGKDLMLMPLRR